MILTINVSYCQNENNTWVFGQYSSCKFIGGNPMILNGSLMSSEEGSSSISDSTGNLLFYSNGEKVWGKNNAVLPNGYNLLGNQSTTQAALFVPMPDSTDKYYLFTIDQLGGNMYYSILDKTLNSGFGDIIPYEKNILLHQNVSEKQIALKRCDGNIWIISHSSTNNQFFADLITSQGINSSIISTVGSSHAGGSSNGTNTVGQMKFSPQGNRIAVAIRDLGKFELFDFDINSGNISSPISIGQGNYPTAYGVEFSPDGTKLYGSTILGGIYQFDLSQMTQSGIQNSAVMIGGTSSQRGQLQLASNGKIYVAQCISQFSPGLLALNVIQNPNSLGVNCNYTLNSLQLGTGHSLLGLPNFMIYMNENGQNETKYFSICKGDSIKIGTVSGMSEYQWIEGSNATTDSIIISPLYSTTYVVHSFNNCDNRSDTIHILVNDTPNIMAGNDTAICEGDSVILSGSGGSSYTWNNNVVDNETFYPSETNEYVVTGTDGNGCSSADSVIIKVNKKPIIIKSNNASICLGDSISLFANGADTVLWNNGIQNNSYFYPTSTMNYSFYAIDSNGCTTIDSIEVIVNNLPDIHANDTIVCMNQNVILHGEGGETYYWSDGIIDGQPFVPQKDTSKYIVVGYDANGCYNSDTVTVIMENNIMPVASLNADQLSGESPLEVTFTNNSTNGQKYTWDFGNDVPIENNSVSIIYSFEKEGIYLVTLSAINGICIDTATVKITVINNDAIYVPNTFTPDGDGLNNIFIPVITKGYDINEFDLVIFNRFGEVVFETHNVDLGWDGTYNGLKCPIGTYVWKLDIKDKYSSVVYSKIGHINLLR